MDLKDDYLDKHDEWYKKAVGGMWHEIGTLQFDFMLKQGLMPDHFFLDVGCGSLRGGIHFINYLKSGNYFGIDKNIDLLNAGRKIELIKNNLIQKNPCLLHMENFDFSILQHSFHYALAQSIFTHLPISDIKTCIQNIDKILVRGGKFYATFFEDKTNTQSIEHLSSDGTHFSTFYDKDPYHYNFETFKQICKGTELSVVYLGNWSHPRDQKMMVFTKR